MLRRFARVFLALSLAVSQAFAGAPVAAPSARGSAAPAEVREGRTQLSAGATSAPDEVAEPPAVATGPVSDTPRSGGVLRMPAVPDGFNTLDRGWIHFAYHPSIRERVEPLIADADAIRRDLSERLGFPVLSRVRVEVARTPGEMATMAPAGAPYPDYAAGVAYPELGLVLVSLTPVYNTADHDVGQIFRHELGHIALHDALGGRPIPRWFDEGFAVIVSGETSTARIRSLWLASVGDTLIPLRDLDRSFPVEEQHAELAYAEAVDVLRFLVRREDAHRFRSLIEQLRNGSTLDRSVLDGYGVDLNTLEQEWREDAGRRYTVYPILFGGTFIWVLAIGLFVFAWRRRKRRDRVTLERWAREEAREDALRKRLAAQAESSRVHIVLTRSADKPPALPPPSEVDVPRVEHDGQWHTLH
ncbi:MAG TPA: peptidase MA family metallohydrolase [Polyangiaceae bacterium]|jgi:hypothetical protein